jgi:hypothetical protein
MKGLKFASIQSATAVSLLIGSSIALLPAHAQQVRADIAEAAQESCIQSAESQGFTLNEVVSVEPSAQSGADGATVVLDLIRDGESFKLTCDYNPASGAAIGDDATRATTTGATDVESRAFPWWWLLLPIIGLPLLWAWTRGRDTAPVARESSRRAYAENTEAIVRSSGRSVNIYDAPGTNNRVTGTLHDGQSVTLSGRYDNEWLELGLGGWVQRQYLETRPRYASR